MKIIVKEVGKKAILKEVETLKLEDMQTLVEGHIEKVSLQNGIDLWCNDEGKFCKDMNVALTAGTAIETLTVIDIIHGTIFFASADGEDVVGLNDGQIEMILNRMNDSDAIFLCGSTVIPLWNLQD